MAKGLFGKYKVSRTDGRDKVGEDKELARYFVLDYIHDRTGREALHTYAASVQHTQPELATVIRDELRSTMQLFLDLQRDKEDNG